MKSLVFAGSIAAVATAVLALLAATALGDGGSRDMLRSASCSKVFYRRSGSPQYLIVSDLALEGPDRAQALQMAKAIEFVLSSEYGFRAGRFTVGYRSCNDAGSEGYDLNRCVGNARAYAADTGVIGVVGPMYSRCAKRLIPILDLAPDGPVGIVTPTSTYPGLTHKAPPMTAPFEPLTYYPSGRRNYARVITTSDYEGPAAALFVKQLNRKSIYLLHDQYGEGTFSALACRSAARKLGLSVKGFEEWDAQASDYRALAKRIKRSGAEAVYLGGIVENNGGRLLKDLRAALGTRVAIVAFDGFMPFSETFQTAGSAAKALYVSDTSYPNPKLTGKARAFVAGFKRYARPADIDLHVLNAAQAAEVLLDAIARSDGTRASVNANIFKTSVKDGILGTFKIDAHGDTTSKGVTFFKLLQDRGRFFKFTVVPKRLSR